MSAAAQFDLIRFEVIKSALLEAAEEMALTLRRSAYSTNIKTRADFSCAIFDHRLHVVSVPFQSLEELALGYVPKSHRLVKTRRHQHFAVRGEANAAKSLGVAPTTPGPR